MSEIRPVFRPKNFRPLRDEQWEMKQAVIARDGLTTCFWCRRPFINEDDATLEHINPLADGGVHDLRNCTLACYECNNRNVPRGLIEHRNLIQEQKAAEAEANRLKNGWARPTDCDTEIAKRFDAIARSRGLKSISYSEAACLLRNIHNQLGRQPPSGAEKHNFKSHFNRWVNTQPLHFRNQ